MQTTTNRRNPADADQYCDACQTNPAWDLCEPCELRNDAAILAESALEELKSLERKLTTQRDKAMNSTDSEILANRRVVKRLTEAHQSLEDAYEAAGYGLS